MNASQYNGLMVVLHQILGRMPDAPEPVVKPLTVHHLDGTSTVTGGEPVRTGWPYDREGPAPVPADPSVPVFKHTGTACRQALAAMLQMLDSWIQGAKDNHEACTHRGENTGSECWRSWAPSDIRVMVNDVASELGLAEFPAPTTPEEDKAL